MIYEWCTSTLNNGLLVDKPERFYLKLKKRHVSGTVYDYIVLSLTKLVILVISISIGYFLGIYLTAPASDALSNIEVLNYYFIILLVQVSFILCFAVFTKWSPIIDVERYGSQYRATIRGSIGKFGGEQVIGVATSQDIAVTKLLANVGELGYSTNKRYYHVNDTRVFTNTTG